MKWLARLIRQEELGRNGWSAPVLFLLCCAAWFALAVLFSHMLWHTPLRAFRLPVSAVGAAVAVGFGLDRVRRRSR